MNLLLFRVQRVESSVSYPLNGQRTHNVSPSVEPSPFARSFVRAFVRPVQWDSEWDCFHSNPSNPGWPLVAFKLHTL